MTPVVADVERLVPLRGGRVLDGLEFVGMRVERGAADVAFQVLHHRGVRLGGGRQRKERERGQCQDPFHQFSVFVIFTNIHIIGGFANYFVNLRIT